MDKDMTDPITLVMEVMEIECERCGEMHGIAYEPTRTAYVDSTQNVGSWLCRDCAKEYHEYWDERWSEYYDGLM